MKKILIIIAISCVLILSGCINTKEARKELIEAVNSAEEHLAELSKDGYLEDNVYYYPDINIKFVFPDNLRFLTDKEINELVYGSSERPSHVDNNVIYEFFAINMDDSSTIVLTSDTPNSDISIDDYVNNFYKTAVANSEIQGTDVSEAENCEICGQNYFKIRSIILKNGRCIDSYITKNDAKFICIQIMRNSDEQIDEYLSLIQAIE